MVQIRVICGSVHGCQVGVFLAYTPVYGHALIGCELCLPQSRTQDRDRCRGAGVRVDIEFAAKPWRARAMISQALEAGVPFAWFTAGTCWPGSPGWTRAQRSLKEIESVNDTLKGRLDLERHGGRTTGVCPHRPAPAGPGCLGLAQLGGRRPGPGAR
jgi:hypothetical protein